MEYGREHQLIKQRKMKTKRTYHLLLSVFTFPLLIGSVLLGFSSCKDEIDASNLVTKTEATIGDYLDSVAAYSDYMEILSVVRTGEGSNTSSLASMLSAYGNYTCFAPNNEAIRKYVLQVTDSVTDDWRVLYDTDSVAIIDLAKNSIIDNGDARAYSIADFPTDGGAFGLPNLNDRMLTCLLDSTGSYVINGMASVDRLDVQLGNGYVQGVNTVITLSTSSVFDLIAAAPNMKVMATLLRETGWADSLIRFRNDENYSTDGYPETERYQSDIQTGLPIAQHRYYGFTGFVETDDVYERELGVTLQPDLAGNISNFDVVLDKLREKCQDAYGTADADDLTSPDNAINRFVAYHFLDGSITYNRLVHHCNEFGYEPGTDLGNPQLTNLSVDVWDFYTTMGKYRRLVKVLQDAEETEHPIYLNRYREYNNGRSGNYRHATPEPEVRGAMVYAQNVYTDEAGVQQTLENNAENGYYYPIDDLLIYDSEVSTNVLNDRLRFDITTILPELWSANIRGAAGSFFTRDYFKNIVNVSDESNIFYLMSGVSGGGSGRPWSDYQGDELIINGVYDFTIKLPPVPREDSYELRFALNMNPRRGMAQIYFGEDPYEMQPTGLPLDLRIMNTDNMNTPSLDIFAIYPWEDDVEDEQTNLTTERNLRNQGYMKAPNYFWSGNNQIVRGIPGASRRIITTQRMEPDKNYYIRFKSALEDPMGQFVVDYIEITPTWMVNQNEEDIW